MALLEGYRIDRAYFTNNERDTICASLIANEPDENGKIRTTDYFLDADEKDTDYKILMETYTLDQIHENTFKKIREDQSQIKRIAIEVAKKNGWIISDVALKDDLAYQRRNEKPLDKKIVAAKEKEIRVAVSLHEILGQHVFTDNPSAEYLFELKLKLFELDFINNNTNRELKKNLRISKTVPQALKAAIELWETK